MEYCNSMVQGWKTPEADLRKPITFEVDAWYNVIRLDLCEISLFSKLFHTSNIVAQEMQAEFKMYLVTFVV